MSTEDEDGDDLELVETEQIILMEDACWIFDPDALHPQSGAAGVLAVIYRGGQLWVLDGETREWLSADEKPGKKAEKLRPVN